MESRLNNINNNLRCMKYEDDAIAYLELDFTK